MRFKKILSFFNPITQVVKAIAPQEPAFIEPTDEEVRVLLQYVIKNFSYFYFYKGKYDWRPIPEVKVTQPFSGWGYVEGRTEALYINKHLSVTEADDDIDFSELCILLNSVPCMLLYSGKGHDLNVHFIGTVEPGSIESLLNLGGVDISTVEAFKQVPSAPRRILTEVFRGLSQQAQGPNGMEEMFRYAMGEKQ